MSRCPIRARLTVHEAQQRDAARRLRRATMARPTRTVARIAAALLEVEADSSLGHRSRMNHESRGFLLNLYNLASSKPTGSLKALLEGDLVPDEQYDNIIVTAVGASIAIGPLVLLPVPGPTEIALSGIWGTMIGAIALKNGKTLSGDLAKRIGLGALTGLGATYGGAKAFTWLLAKFPGIGTITGTAASSALNGALTLWVAFAMVDLFEQHRRVDAEYCIEFLLDEMKPKMNKAKIRRIAAFIKRV